MIRLVRGRNSFRPVIELLIAVIFLITLKVETGKAARLLTTLLDRVAGR